MDVMSGGTPLFSVVPRSREKFACGGKRTVRSEKRAPYRSMLKSPAEWQKVVSVRTNGVNNKH
jgi:hypothetical protein